MLDGNMDRTALETASAEAYSGGCPSSTAIRMAERMQGLRGRLARNSAMYAAARVIVSTSSLLVVPVIVSRLGIHGYGVWECLLAVAGISTVAQSATGATLLWRMSAAFGREDHAEATRLSRIGLGISLLLAMALGPAAWLGRTRLVAVLHVPPSYAGPAAIIAPWVITQSLLGGGSEALASLLAAYQKAGTAVLIQAAGLTLNYLVGLAGILCHLGIWSLLIGHSAGFAVTSAGLAAAARLHCGGVSLVPILPTRSDWRAMRWYFANMTAGSLSIALRDQTDKIILATCASPVWVGWYGIASRLAAVVTLVCGFFYVPVTSAVGALHAAHDWPAVRRLYSEASVVVGLLCGIFVALVAGLYDSIVPIWIGRAIPQVGPILLVLLVGYGSAALLTGMGSSVCKGIGRPVIETSYILLSISLNIGLKYVLVTRYGGFGTVLASAVSWSLGSVFFVIILHKTLDLPWAATARSACTIPIILLAVAAGRCATLSIGTPVSRHAAFLTAAAAGAAIAIVFAAAMLVFGMVTRDHLRAARQQFSANLATVFGL